MRKKQKRWFSVVLKPMCRPRKFPARKFPDPTTWFHTARALEDADAVEAATRKYNEWKEAEWRALYLPTLPVRTYFPEIPNHVAIEIELFLAYDIWGEE